MGSVSSFCPQSQYGYETVLGRPSESSQLPPALSGIQPGTEFSTGLSHQVIV